MKVKNGFWYTVAMCIVSPFVKVFYRYTVQGLDKIPSQGGYIICANHSSCVDPVLLVLAIKRKLFFIAKDELFHNKAIAFWLTKLGAFPIKRRSIDMSALDKSKKILQKGLPLCIFIEGTRSKDGEFLPAKAGAAMISYQTQKPVLPVCITCEEGGRVRCFTRTKVSIGDLIQIDELQIKESKGSEFRRGSRLILDKIKNLRE